MAGFFPVQSTTLLYRIGLLVKQARLRLAMRQVDLAHKAGTSLRTVRHIEAGKAEGVSLRDFMLVLFTAGVSDRVFQALQEDPAFETEALEAYSEKRVRLARVRAEDF
ncbi:transcriptional regulator [Pseudomonas sp. DTU_2021_1001937_2_SI_NGA_ILE_001]|uniref:helix-turn-helix domain-containing protein n=1 Tax=Pseudomonas sp. DTU_2021_1001937_2_SI_NGA_ILE_001 TaxID=3077589 RepID=UPI0028FC1B98|nr:helix-turn-helix domain-containing protein [Pseudomonas sp. DTU_2021_1001937_2_SI_NGA_ILE_001]WNW12751.1 transcriptional regulator [Pseudomonas sp. DTU_2021_1001937_2_SI_NGA_ILE_001]